MLPLIRCTHAVRTGIMVQVRISVGIMVSGGRGGQASQDLILAILRERYLEISDLHLALTKYNSDQ